MRVLMKMFLADCRHRMKDGFAVGYNIIFPLLMIVLLGYLTSTGYGDEFTGYQYYSAVMLPFCIAMAMITAAYSGKEDAFRKTAIRFLYSPVSRLQIVMSKLLSCLAVLSLCNAIVLAAVVLLWEFPAGPRLIPLFLLLTSETFCCCAAGLWIGFGMKNFLVIKNVMNIPISVFAVLGGVFYPMGSLNPGIALIFRLSPLTWINRSIFLLLYDRDTELIRLVTAILIIAGIGFMVLAIGLFRREEYIHGDLPGFNQ